MSVWVKEPTAFIESAKVMGGYAETMKGAVMLILAFYFAAPHMGILFKSRWISLAEINKKSCRTYLFCLPTNVGITTKQKRPRKIPKPLLFSWSG